MLHVFWDPLEHLHKILQVSFRIKKRILTSRGQQPLRGVPNHCTRNSQQLSPLTVLLSSARGVKTSAVDIQLFPSLHSLQALLFSPALITSCETGVEGYLGLQDQQVIMDVKMQRTSQIPRVQCALFWMSLEVEGLRGLLQRSKRRQSETGAEMVAAHKVAGQWGTGQCGIRTSALAGDREPGRCTLALRKKSSEWSTGTQIMQAKKGSPSHLLEVT